MQPAAPVAVPAPAARREQALRPQAKLSRKVDQCLEVAYCGAIAALPADSRLVAQAQHRSQKGKGALAWLGTPASASAARTIHAQQWRETARRSLGVERTCVGGICGKCDSVMSGTHARRCSKTGEQNFRHHMLRNMLWTELGARGKLVGVQKEISAPFHTRESSMDVVIPGNQMSAPSPMDATGASLPGTSADVDASKGMLIDVNVSDNTGSLYLTRAAVIDGYATRVNAEKKILHYSGKFDPTSFTLLPFCFETFGRSSRHVSKFLTAVAAHQESTTGGAWPASLYKCWWRQSLSITLQSAISVSVTRAMARARQAPDSAAPPAIGAYLSERLLLRAPPAPPPAVGLDLS